MRCKSDTLEFKDTESFWLGFHLTEADCTTAVAVSERVVFQIYNINDELVCEPDVTITNKAAGEFVATTDDPIPTGKYRVDVLFIEGGEQIASETFALKVTKGYSRKVS